MITVNITPKNNWSLIEFLDKYNLTLHINIRPEGYTAELINVYTGENCEYFSGINSFYHKKSLEEAIDYIVADVNMNYIFFKTKKYIFFSKYTKIGKGRHIITKTEEDMAYIRKVIAENENSLHRRLSVLSS